MKYQFIPYGKLPPMLVKSTGKIYEVGEHPTYKDDRIIEVYDAEGKIHDAFVDELTSDEVKQQERSYSEEDLKEAFKYAYTVGFRSFIFDDGTIKQENCEEWFELFKNK